MVDHGQYVLFQMSPSGDPWYDLLCIISPLSHRKVMPYSIAFFFANRMPCGLVCHHPVLLSSLQSKWLVACYCVLPLSFFLGLMVVPSLFTILSFTLVAERNKILKFSAFVSYHTDYMTSFQLQE